MISTKRKKKKKSISKREKVVRLAEKVLKKEQLEFKQKKAKFRKKQLKLKRREDKFRKKDLRLKGKIRKEKARLRIKKIKADLAKKKKKLVKKKLVKKKPVKKKPVKKKPVKKKPVKKETKTFEIISIKEKEKKHAKELLREELKKLRDVVDILTQEKKTKDFKDAVELNKQELLTIIAPVLAVNNKLLYLFKVLQFLSAGIDNLPEEDHKGFDNLTIRNIATIELLIEILRREKALGNNYVIRLTEIVEAGRRSAGVITRTITPTRLQVLANMILRGLTHISVQGIGSDSMDSHWFAKYEPLTVQRVQVSNNNNGKFFDRVNISDIDLKKYQIYTKKDLELDTDRNLYNEHCFIYALNQYGLEIPNSVRQCIKKAYLKKQDIKKIANLLNIRIQLSYYRKKRKNQIENRYYGVNKESPLYKIAIYNSHYFYNEDNALYQIKHLDDTKKFEYCSLIGKYVEGSKNKDCLKNIESKLYVYKKPKGNTRLIVSADIETDPKDTHKPYMVVHRYGDVKFISFGENCIKNFLRKLPMNSMVYYHNAKYDFSFMRNYVKMIRSIEKNGQIYEMTCMFGKKKIIFRDSYKIISSPLSAFPNMFKLEKIKEAYPYTLYTVPRIFNEISLPIDEALKHMPKKKHKRFRKMIKKLKCESSPGYFDHVKYAKYYCGMDVDLLHEGLHKFDIMMRTTTGLSIFDYLSISSMAHSYLSLQKVYEGVHVLMGDVRSFVQRSNVGGQVCLRHGKKHILNGKIRDFDACSLYPSAMFRLGYPKGPPKTLTKAMLNEMNTRGYGEGTSPLDHYVVEINITKVNKHLSMPCISHKNKKGIREYTNEPIKNVVVDKITLEDYIKYQKIEFEIIRGVYWNEGLNNKIKEVIKYLYDERLKMKEQKNLIQLIYKLIMNSSYGKTIMKASNSEIKYFRLDQLDMVLSKYYNRIIEVLTYEKFIKVKLMSSVKIHENMTHIGGMILSMSKRIMNEVKCTAFEHKIPIFYQDTDSMHLYDKDVPILAKLFEKKYHRKLIGENMGQFHNDFKLKPLEVKIKKLKKKAKKNGFKFEIKKDSKDVWSNKCIILGKKCYLDCLEGVVIINDKEIRMKGYHIRMKGVSSSAIAIKAKELNGYENIFEKLYDGKNNITFDLVSKFSPKFKYDKYGNVRSLESFKRKIQFPDKK